MRSNRDPEKNPAYHAAARFVNEALRTDGSLFLPEKSVWSARVLDDLHTRFNLSPDESSDTFVEKLQRQLAGATLETVVLAAEVVFVHFLIARDISAPVKRKLVETILSWSPEPVAVPADLESAFETGVCNTGIAFKTYRPHQLWLIIDTARLWKAFSEERRSSLLDDPWAFKGFLESVPQRAAFTQRQALLHLIYPEVFEDMVSREHKALIIATLGPDVPNGLPEDPDLALAEIRSHFELELGDNFSFYESPLVERWRVTPAKPAPSDDPPQSHRRAWLIRGTVEGGDSLVPDWVKNGYCSIGWPQLGELPLDIGRVELIERMRTTYPDASDGSVRAMAGVILRFLQAVQPTDIVLAPQGSDLYVGIAEGDLKYQAGAAHPWTRSVDWANSEDPIDRSSISPSLYSKLRTLLTITDISENMPELEAFLTPEANIRAKRVAEKTEKLMLKQPPGTLAGDLCVPPSWLEEQVALLQSKRQLIFYGPPGTGKTFLAQEIADFLTSEGGNFVLVQFHPSYSYEDFFEGFRPRSTGDGSGAIGFELVPGPLRRLAEEAKSDRSHPYILIIDEINRANVAKVFGEMYFLLEYRDRAVTLQYSADETFTLPENVFIIGTMNTVDRSIDLLDAAMRRRFYFSGLLPNRPPVDDMLANWLKKRGLSNDVANLLRRLNERIGDPEAAIGPSYFMDNDIGDDKVLKRIWDHAILPRLEEHHFGSGVDVGERYRLEELRQVGTDLRSGGIGPEPR